MGSTLIVAAFLRWVETAKTQERARAANALARAYLKSDMAPEERQSAQMAMTYLLDDPSPKVRLALAENLKSNPDVPREIALRLRTSQFRGRMHARGFTGADAGPHFRFAAAVGEHLRGAHPFLRGIRAAVEWLASHRPSLHEAHHEVMEALGEMVWESQRLGKPFDGERYIERIRQRAMR